MNIKSVKLSDSGLKGLEVEHFVPVIGRGKEYLKPVWEKPKDPVHRDLLNLFADLKSHLLSICDLTVEGKDIRYLEHETQITGVEFDSDTFTITGLKRVFGDKFVKLKTPKVEETDIPDTWEGVREILNKIASETALYVQGSKKITDDELVETWVKVGKDKDVSSEAYEAMTADEKKEYHTRILEEQFGSFVQHREDIDIEDVPDMEKSIVIPEDEDTIIIGFKKDNKEAV